MSDRTATVPLYVHVTGTVRVMDVMVDVVVVAVVVVEDAHT
jgi:hypothetical protein